MWTSSGLPSYDQLPVVEGAPKGSSWGLWGPDDVLGCLNLLGPEQVRVGLASAQNGSVFNLDADMELFDPPMFGRTPFRHVLTDLEGIGHEDHLDGWNTQTSSQWDGFRHLRHPAWGYYNGVDSDRHGVDHWARRGIVGRGVLADVARWRAEVGRPIVAEACDVISVEDLDATLASQGVILETGDILLIRTGWLAWYSGAHPGERRAIVRQAAQGATGIARGRTMARWLWDKHVAAVAADNPTLEAMPYEWSRGVEEGEGWRDDPDRAAESMLHFSLLGLLGIPIGELFDLDALSTDCATDRRWTFLLTSSPMPLSGGVASPPNALAIK